MNTGDTAWVLVSTALVLLMTPGLAIFYGGMVRAKNVLSTLMHSFLAIGLVTVQWVVVGYSLAFAKGNALIGGFDHLMLDGVGAEPGPYAATIPHTVFMAFQGMFAIITPALISGAFAERIRFRAYVLFTLAWTTLVYDPVCHWVWAKDGWLFELGALDFAGGTVVHVNSGVAALATVLVLGRRLDARLKPHNLALTVLGAGLLCFGWFGFNAGSALAADGKAAHAFVTTWIGAGAGAVAWALVQRLKAGTSSALGVASGAVAGLVGITPACGFVTFGGALAIGAAAGVVCYGGIFLKDRLGYDDSLDAFGVHGVGGIFGALATGVFAAASVGGTPGVLDGGNWRLLGVQFLATAVTAVYSFGVTWLIVKVLDATIGLRVSEKEEKAGLDLVAHGERAFSLTGMVPLAGLGLENLRSTADPDDTGD